MIDPTNPVVKLCAEGIQAEAKHEHAKARVLYAQAWDQRADDYEACIAAHYLAREQETLQDSLHWNQLALDHALIASVELVGGFLPSLYLNLGWSHEVLGDIAQARTCYEEGKRRLAALPPEPYAEVVRTGIMNGLQRTVAE